MKLGIIGCGLIGKKRVAALGPDDRVVAVTDLVPERAAALARESGARVLADAHSLLREPEVEAVVIATTHDQLAALALESVECGKHVLLEKPGARKPAELQPVEAAAARRGVSVHVGFNHRFHPALQKAKQLIDEGALGDLFFIRGRYGHGGRLGYEREWRAQPEVSGGGELLDQGAHLIDLSAWLFGERFETVHGVIATYYWQMPVEDNAFLTLQTASSRIAQLHVTWTEWKNTFALEITGRNAKLHIEGLGGSYGTERLAFYQMRPELGPPDTTIWEYPGADSSWNLEWQHFKQQVAKHQVEGAPGLSSTREVLSVIERVYRMNKVSWVGRDET
jgi:predicted dehydrogenase